MTIENNQYSANSLIKKNTFDKNFKPYEYKDKNHPSTLLKIAHRHIPFFKITSFGNNFIIVDETKGFVLSEQEKSKFAFQATNANFGVGSDNLIVIQPFNSKNMLEINSERKYWKKIPLFTEADLIFRMFEPDGTEAYSCGSGVMCVTHYLFIRFGKDTFKLVTQIPAKNPKITHSGVKKNGMSVWANMGNPSRINKSIVHSDITKKIHPTIDRLDVLSIEGFWQYYGIKKAFRLPHFLSGYLVFTGEPHFVIFTDLESELTASKITPFLFSCNYHHGSSQIGISNLFSSANEFINALGLFIQNKYAHIFPFGMNINFVTLSEDRKMIEHRCFERGLDKETLTCGSGALASAYIARTLNIVTENNIGVIPYLCRENDCHAVIHIESAHDGWRIYGSPVILFRGTFFFDN